MIIGYARVSTPDQSLTDQVAQLKAAGCSKIFSEKASGTIRDRRQLARALGELQEGDQLVVTALDRLGRSAVAIFRTIEAIDDRKAGFRSLREPWADLSSPAGRFMVQILGAVAEIELSLINERLQAGQRRAKAAGVKFGRPEVLTPAQKRWAISERARPNPPSYGALAATLDVAVSTVKRACRTPADGAHDG